MDKYETTNLTKGVAKLFSLVHDIELVFNGYASIRDQGSKVLKGEATNLHLNIRACGKAEAIVNPLGEVDCRVLEIDGETDQ